MNLDRTFCACKEHKPDCDRQITPEVEAAMKRAGKKHYSVAFMCCDIPETKESNWTGRGRDENHD